MHVLTVRRIRQLQQVGLSLAQIGDIFTAADPDAMLHQTLVGLRAQVETQLQQLTERRDQIVGFLAEQTSLRDMLRSN